MKRPLIIGALTLGVFLGPSAAEAAKTTSPTVSGLVNLNKATPEQLKMLPGVKDKAVEKIIAHREKHPFTRVEELVNVKGFSKRRYQRVKPFITVHGDSTIRTAERLVRKAVRAGEKKLKK